MYEKLIGKAKCKCDEKFVGDGINCQLEPECELSSDCMENAYCSRGFCVCNEGYQRNAGSDVYVKNKIIFFGFNILQNFAFSVVVCRLDIVVEHFVQKMQIAYMITSR